MLGLSKWVQILCVETEASLRVEEKNGGGGNGEQLMESQKMGI